MLREIAEAIADRLAEDTTAEQPGIGLTPIKGFPVFKGPKVRVPIAALTFNDIPAPQGPYRVGGRVPGKVMANFQISVYLGNEIALWEMAEDLNAAGLGFAAANLIVDGDKQVEVSAGQIARLPVDAEESELLAYGLTMTLTARWNT